GWPVGGACTPSPVRALVPPGPPAYSILGPGDSAVAAEGPRGAGASPAPVRIPLPRGRGRRGPPGRADGRPSGKDTTMTPDMWTRREMLAFTGLAGLGALGLAAGPPLGLPSAYSRKVLAKKPVAYWRLGEARGPTASDATKNAHHGKYHGSPTFRQPGALRGDADTAIALDGKKSYVEVPDSKAFSVAASGRGLSVE